MQLTSLQSLGATGKTNLKISQAELSSMLMQIETELHNSEIYQRALGGLETILGEYTAKDVQMIVNEVAGEAIKLAFQQLALKTPDKKPVVIQNSQENPPVLPPATNSITPIAAPLSRAEKEARLREIGQKFRAARLAQSLTLRQLHNQSLIVPHQIHTLETGRVELLPDDLYLKYMIRQIGDTLGFDGAAMADFLSTPVSESDYITENTSASTKEVNDRPFHLYFGYAAVMAGAVGGIASMTQAATNVNVNIVSPVEVAQSSRAAEIVAKPGLKSSKIGMVVKTDIAPPEIIRN